MTIKPTFEESIDAINNEINKRRRKWSLTVISWMDFDDVAQLLRIHINIKWHLYDAKRAVGPWVNKIISNYIRNIIRNVYGNYSKPCLKCAASEGDGLCSIYVKQCADCPLFKYWENNKKDAYNTKLPVSLENHTQEVYNLVSDSIDIERSGNNLHEKMKTILRPQEWAVYKHLYIDNGEEKDVAQIMGYKTNEKKRHPGYKQIKNLRKILINKVKKVLASGDVEIV